MDGRRMNSLDTNFISDGSSVLLDITYGNRMLFGGMTEG